MTDQISSQSTEDYLLDDVTRRLAAKGLLPDLPRKAAHTHMGFYLGWAIHRDLMSHQFHSEYADDVAALKDQRLSGPQLAGRLGGVLRVSLFNDELARFSRSYYSKSGRFFADYVHAFSKPIVQARSMYVVADTQENQDKLSCLLDQRLDAWRTYPPAAERIFGEEVGVGSYQDLETVTQMALLVAAKALKLTRTCHPFVLFLTPSNEVRVPQLLPYKGQDIHVMTDEGVVAAGECLREGLKRRTVKAFATARLQPYESSTPLGGIEVTAQHFKSGPHRVTGPYASDAATGMLTFERPVSIPNTPVLPA